MANEAKMKDALSRCLRILEGVEYMRLSRYSWQLGIDTNTGEITDYTNNPEKQFIDLSDADPIEWEGEPGTHPLISFIKSALDDESEHF